MQFQRPSVVHAVPAVTAPADGVTTTGAGVAGAAVADGTGLTTTVVSATGDGATGVGAGEVVMIGDGAVVGSATAFAVGVISTNAPPETTGGSDGVAGVDGMTTLETGSGAAEVATTGSGELVSGMLPTVSVRVPTVLGLQELGPELQPRRRLAISDA